MNPSLEDDPILPLVRKIREGRDVRGKAVAEIHRRLYRSVFALFADLGLSTEEAEDLTQETFLWAFSHLESFFRGGAKFGRWVFEIAVNVYRNEVRRRTESELMSRIRRDFPDEAKARYRDLARKRDAGALSPAEHQELIRLANRLEAWQAERLNALADLSALRGTTVDALLQELDFKPLLDD